MLTQLHLENFKGWEDTGSVRLAPITVLFGSNSSGKTSLLQSLLLLKQTAESSDRFRVLHTGDERTPVDLGTMSDVVFGHDLARTLKIGLVWRLPEPLDIPGERLEQIQFSLEVCTTSEGQPFVRLARYHMDRSFVAMERRKETFVEAVARWLKELGVIDSFDVVQVSKNRKDYEVRVRRTSQSAEVLITDVGVGVSQVLPVVVQCFYAAPGSTVIFEQPEIHLHPRVQAALADLLVEAATAGGVQFIVESHSEHFLRRLQRRVAEEVISEEQVALYVCDVADGKSRLEALKVDTYGNIINWPKDFFGDEIGDLTAMTEAAMKRRKKR